MKNFLGRGLTLLTLSLTAPSVLGCVGMAAIALGSVGCDDASKAGDKVAKDTLAFLAPMVEKDVDDVRTGLPEGAKVLADKLLDDPASDLLGTQTAIRQAREKSDKLRLAKSTFFVLTTPEGLVLRSESDPDRLVDKNVFTPFPELKKAVGSDKPVEVYGEMDEMRGVKTGPDTTWVIGLGVAPGKGKDAKPRGAFVTGWSFRAYAYYLQLQVDRNLNEDAKKANSNKVPIVQVYVVKGAQAYGQPTAPDATVERISKLDLPSKAKSAPYLGRLEIEGRTFSVAAQAAPALGPDTVIAVAATVY